MGGDVARVTLKGVLVYGRATFEAELRDNLAQHLRDLRPALMPDIHITRVADASSSPAAVLERVNPAFVVIFPPVGSFSHAQSSHCLLRVGCHPCLTGYIGQD